MKLLPTALLALALILWTVAFFYPQHSPMEIIGGDKVYPQTVHPGETISIFRSFNVTRLEPMGVTRRMIKGDCKKTCEIVDLVHGSFLPDKIGPTIDVKRDHTIPMNITPGHWRVMFAVTWHDWLGRTKTMELPELSVEVE